MATPVIKTAAASDEAHVIDVLVRAFAADPAARGDGLNSSNVILCIFLALSGHSVAKRLHTEAPTILKVSEFFFNYCGFITMHVKKERKSRVLWPPNWPYP